MLRTNTQTPFLPQESRLAPVDTTLNRLAALIRTAMVVLLIGNGIWIGRVCQSLDRTLTPAMKVGGRPQATLRVRFMPSLSLGAMLI